MAHILVVEDQKTVLIQVELCSRSRGHAVITATTVTTP